MLDLSDSLGPLLLQGRLQPTLWGGRNLARIAGKSLPEGATIGESWETAVESVVRNAPHAGATLGVLVERFGEQLIGTRAAEVFGRRFPLLTKFIDAQQPLSVQAHPNDEYAARTKTASSARRKRGTSSMRTPAHSLSIAFP